MLAQIDKRRVLGEWRVMGELRVLAKLRVLAEQIILNLTMFMHLLFLDSFSEHFVKHPFKLIFV